jgi:predicted nucleotidyltransferase
VFSPKVWQLTNGGTSAVFTSLSYGTTTLRSAGKRFHSIAFHLRNYLSWQAALRRRKSSKRPLKSFASDDLEQNLSAGRPGLYFPVQMAWNILTFRPKRRIINVPVSIETNILIQRAAAELKTAGAREIYVFGSAAKGTDDAASDLDLAVSGLPPSVFYRMGARVSDLIGRSVDLIDLDINTPFTRYLRTENELVRVG